MECIPVVYSTVSRESILKVLKEFYFNNSDIGITFIKRGFNDTYLIESNNSKNIFRIYNSNWRNWKNIETEITFLNYLNQYNCFVSKPVYDKLGKAIQFFFTPEGERYAVLYSFAEGNSIRKLSLEQSKNLGVQTGRMHRLASSRSFDDCAFKYNYEIIFEETLSVLSPILTNYQKEFEYLKKLKTEFVLKWNSVNSMELAIGICHGDLQSENFHFSDLGKITFFDFDFMGKGCLIYDIGVFIWYDHKNKNKNIINSFLKGYSLERKLSNTEIELLPYFSTLRALFQMTLICKTNDGERLPLWSPHLVAEFVNKIEKWHSKICKEIFSDS